MVYIWNEHWQVFCDEAGMPLPFSSLVELAENLAQQAKMSPEELASIAKEIAHTRFPKLSEGMDFSPERYA